MKNRYFYNIDLYEWKMGKAFMFSEVASLEVYHPINILLREAISDFEAGKFSYDGATFVKERGVSLFEVAAFIHDWRNALGYVGKEVDNEMFDIMIVLNYDLKHIILRYFLTRFTFINVIRHKIMHTFVRNNPNNLFKK